MMQPVNFNLPLGVRDVTLALLALVVAFDFVGQLFIVASR